MGPGSGISHSNQEILKAIRHIDHVTYAVSWEHETTFIRRWEVLGFKELVRLNTERFPATHIALTSGEVEGFPWATMTGLSISYDKNSPINEYIHRYGEGIQHVAYNVDPQADMEQLEQELYKLGWRFMTPVLTYKDGQGAHLRQMFTAPEIPHGPFIELAQRLPGEDGAVFNGFDTSNIDDLYQHYSDYSRWLEKNPKAEASGRTKVLAKHAHMEAVSAFH